MDNNHGYKMIPKIRNDKNFIEPVLKRCLCVGTVPKIHQLKGWEWWMLASLCTDFIGDMPWRTLVPQLARQGGRVLKATLR